jgi:formylglycine-generating enzyme required for sulfatase activity
MSEPVKVFLSYSHQDEELRNDLVKHLAGLRQRGLIDLWHDRKIKAGAEWAEQIDKNLEQAHIILFLVSVDFINSEYCSEIEMRRALERHNGKTAHVIPVIVRECDWHHAPFAKLQAVPTDGRAVTSWGTDRYAPDRAWTVVAREIGKIAQQVADELQALKRSLENVPPDAVPTLEPLRAEVKATEPQRSQKIELKPHDKASSKVFTFEVVTVNAKGEEIDRQSGQSEYFAEDLGSGIILEMVPIPGGTFQMGSPSTELERTEREGPQHKVTVPAFWMGRYAITQEQWRAVANLPKISIDLDSDLSQFKGDKRPVETVSWTKAIEFCARLSKKSRKPFRLPSEAEWEYACRAGTNTPFHFGETITPELANYDENYAYGKAPKGLSREQTTEVGSFKIANAYGLYDMHGNVWEWCQDHWHGSYAGAPVNGGAWVKENDNDSHIVRGGSWNYGPRLCRSAYRVNAALDSRNFDAFGFRVVCDSPSTL